MKVVIPIIENSLQSKISLRFARSKYFAIIDKEKSKYKIIANDQLKKEDCIGKDLLDMLCNEHHVNTLFAYELGLNIQQIAAERRIQLLILNEKHKTLKELLLMMNITI